jgi:AcrR family transcriptional regulator
MPRKKQSDEQVNAMRNRILDASVMLLDTLQPEQISIRKIAEKAGLSHMAIYTYFQDRDALVQALISRQENQVRSRFEKILQSGEDEDLIQNLKKALQDYIDKAKSRPKLFRLLWILPFKKLNGPVGRKMLLDNQFTTLVGLIEKGQQKGLFCDKEPRVAALTLISLINAPLFLFHLGRLSDTKLRDAVIDETLNLAIEYITNKSK